MNRWPVARATLLAPAALATKRWAPEQGGSCNLKRIDNAYDIVSLASQRAKDILDGSEPKLD